MFQKFGFQLRREQRLICLEKFTSHLIQNLVPEPGIDSIVFSKDRAMQLHAFLLSYIEQVSNRGKMYILYKCTSEQHEESYEQLKAIFMQENFVFIHESNFRRQLIEICDCSEAGKLIFYVDDMIFTHSISYQELDLIDTRYFVLALSRGKDLDYSIVLEKPLILPPFSRYTDHLYSFKWNYSDEYSDWTFPLGVSGYMFGRKEITAMIKSISFKAPNTLEWAMQIYLPFFKGRFGLCTEFASSVCVHANLVQSEGYSPDLGTFSVEELLVIWNTGKRINVREFYNKPIMTSQQQSYSFH